MAYNGWKNYETWNVALWIDNDQGSYSRRQEMAQEAWDDAEACSTFTREEQAVLDLAEALKGWIEEDNPLSGDASLYSDLLSAALSEVDWHEIAENFIEDVEKEDEDSDEDDEEETEDETEGGAK